MRVEHANQKISHKLEETIKYKFNDDQCEMCDKGEEDESLKGERDIFV